MWLTRHGPPAGMPYVCGSLHTCRLRMSSPVPRSHKLPQERKDVSFGLVTGNLEPIGWGKMRALGVLSLFSEPLWGGFGSDFCSGDTGEPWRDRGELVRLAKQRWLQQTDTGEWLK